jgi:hypothetical protein
MDTCPHCGEGLPVEHGTHCPDCEQLLNDEEMEEPQEGDYIILNNRGKTIITKCGEFHYYKVIKETSEAYSIIKNEMEREKFWSSIWILSDHGNYALINLDSLEKEIATPLNCVECYNYDIRKNKCLESESFFDNENLSIGKCEFFRKGE